MTEEQTDEARGKRPDASSHLIRTDRDGNEKWVKLGPAWQHKDGQGFNIQPDDPAYGDRIVLRTLRDEAQAGAEQSRRSAPERADKRDRGRQR